MTVSVNATRTESVRTDTSNPYAFNYTPGAGTVIGIVVTAIHSDSSTDHITGMTYGGSTMQRAITAADTSTEQGRADIWYLKGPVPSGTQEISVSLASGTTDDIQFVAFAINGAASTSRLALVDTDLVEQNTSNPSRTMNYGGLTCVSISAFYFGGSAAPTPNVNMTNLYTHDFTAQFGSVDMQTTPGTTDFVVSYLGNDDTGLAIASFTEAALQTLAPTVVVDSDDGFFTHEIVASFPEQFLTPDLFAESDGYFTPSILLSLQASLYAEDDTYFTHEVVPGEVALQAGLYADDDAFFTHALTANFTLVASLYEEADAYFDLRIFSVNPVTSNIVAWYKRGQGIIHSGGAVSQWSDFSGNGHHLVQATGGRQPTKQTNDAIQFDGTSDFLDAGSFTLNQPCTIYALVRQLGWTSGRWMWGSPGAAVLRQKPSGAGGNSPEVEIFAGTGAGEDANLALNQWGVVSVVFDGASSFLGINKNTGATLDAGTNNPGGFVVGAKADNTTWSNCEFLEVIIYSGAHDAATRNLVISYLYEVYSPSLPRFAKTGGTNLWYGATVGPNAQYFSDTDTTWFTWEATYPPGPGGTRRIEGRTYNHTTGEYTPVVVIGTVTLTDDDHGVPAICRDDNGYVYCFYGAHGDPQQLSVTTNPNDPSAWTARTAISSQIAYPHPDVVGGVIYLFNREDTDSGDRKLSVIKSTSLTGGNPTWGTKTNLISLGPDARLYQGNHVIVGTDIHIVFTRSNQTDDYRRNVYYAVYDTTTGEVRNFDDTYSELSTLPVDLTAANTNFRIYEHTGGTELFSAPAFGIDTDGHPHVVFHVGTTATKDIYHIWHNGTSWQSATDTVFNGDASVVIVQRPAGVMRMYWTEGRLVKYADRDSDGSWGSPIYVTSEGFIGGFGYTSIATVRDADPECYVVFQDYNPGAVTDELGTLKGYGFGDSGFLPDGFEGLAVLIASLYADDDAFFTHTVTTANTLVTSLYADDEAYYTHEVLRGTVTLQVSLYTDDEAYYTHLVTVGVVTLVAPLHEDVDGFLTHTMSQGAIVPSLYVDADAFFTPVVVRGTVSLQPTLYVDADNFPSAVVTQGVVLQPNLYVDSEAFYTHVLSSGGLALVPQLYVDTDGYFTHAVSPGVVALQPTLYIDSDATFSASIVGQGTLAPQRFDEVDGFFTPTIVPDQLLVAGLFIESDIFFGPTISTGGLSLLPSLYTDDDGFFTTNLRRNLRPPLLGSDDSFEIPLIVSAAVISAALYQDSDSFYTHVMQGGFSLPTPEEEGPPSHRARHRGLTGRAKGRSPQGTAVRSPQGTAKRR